MKTTFVSSPQKLHPIQVNPFTHIRNSHTRLETMLDRAEDIVLRLNQYDLGNVCFSAWTNNFCTFSGTPDKFELVMSMHYKNAAMLPSIHITQISVRETIELRWSPWVVRGLVRHNYLTVDSTEAVVETVLELWSKLIKEMNTILCTK